MSLKISENSQQMICAGVSFLKELQTSDCNLIQKEALTHVFSRKSANFFFTRTTLSDCFSKHLECKSI